MLAMLTVTMSCTTTQPTATVSPAPAASTHRVAGLEATPSCRGYWFAGSDGAIFPFGDAGEFGSTVGVQLNKRIVGMESTPDGAGYWLVASDGGVFPFGDASGYGGTSDTKLNQPIGEHSSQQPDRRDGVDARRPRLLADRGRRWLFLFGDAPGYGTPPHV